MKQVNFPIWKLRKFQEIDRTILGLVKIKSRNTWYILDDTSIKEDFLKNRRLKLLKRYPKKEIYHLNNKINYLRQLIKCKNRSYFIDTKGNIFSYIKTSGLNKIISKKIIKCNIINDYSVFFVQDEYYPFLVNYDINARNINYASIMYTKYGPLLYDLTKDRHNEYKRKI